MQLVIKNHNTGCEVGYIKKNWIVIEFIAANA